MTETVAVQSPVAASTSLKKAKQTSKNTAGAKKSATSKPKINHPPAGEMVNAAIAALKDRKGSSLQAIKKYIAETYKVDVKKQSVFIRKYLKSAVEKQTIIQAKGTGASGRFKLAGEAEKKVATKSTAKKPAATTAKKPAAKKATVEKKPATKKQSAAKTIAAKTSPSKVKKTGKASAAKTPKPKKVVPKAKPAKK